MKEIQELINRLEALSGISKTKLTSLEAEEIAQLKQRIVEHATTIGQHAASSRTDYNVGGISPEKTASIAELAELDLSEVIGMDDPDWTKIPEAILRLQSAHSAAGAYLALATSAYEAYKAAYDHGCAAFRRAAPAGYTEADYDSLERTALSDLRAKLDEAKIAMTTASTACNLLNNYFQEVSRIQAALEYELQRRGVIG